MSEDQEVAVIHRSPSQRKGFAQIPHAVLTDPALSDGAVRLYGILLSYAFQGESFKCSQLKMASDIGKDDRTIRRLMKELHTRALVTPVRQGQRMVNIYVLEDAYALYDGERPEPKKRTRTPIGQDKSVRSEGDRTKMSGQVGQMSPVMQDKNVLLLKTQENNLNKKGVSTSSLFPETEQQPSWVELTEAARTPWLDQARGELVAIHTGSGIPPKPRLIDVRARNLYETSLSQKQKKKD